MPELNELKPGFYPIDDDTMGRRAGFGTNNLCVSLRDHGFLVTYEEIADNLLWNVLERNLPHLYELAGRKFIPLDEYLQHRNRAAGPRTHVVKRGESLHGICKRLTGSASPWDLTEWRDRLIRANNLNDSVPLKEGATLIIPDTFPAKPVIDGDSPAGAQRLSLMAMDQRDAAYQQVTQLMLARDDCREQVREMRRIYVGAIAVAIAGWIAATAVFGMYLSAL